MLFFSFLWVDKQITNVVHRHSISSTSAIAERAFDWLASLHGCPAPFNSVCEAPPPAMLVLSPIVLCCVPAGDVSSPPSTATAPNEAPSFHGQCNQSQFHAARFSLRAVSVCVCVWLHWLICVRLCAFHGHRRCIACIGLYACLMWTCTCP